MQPLRVRPWASRAAPDTPSAVSSDTAADGLGHQPFPQPTLPHGLPVEERLGQKGDSTSGGRRRSPPLPVGRELMQAATRAPGQARAQSTVVSDHSPPPEVTVVTTAEELQEAALEGARDIEIRAHMDLRGLEPLSEMSGTLLRGPLGPLWPRPPLVRLMQSSRSLRVRPSPHIMRGIILDATANARDCSHLHCSATSSASVAQPVPCRLVHHCTAEQVLCIRRIGDTVRRADVVVARLGVS